MSRAGVPVLKAETGIGSDVARAEARPATPAPPPKGSRKRVVLLVILAIALMAGSYFGYGWWTNGRFFVSTDDAYVGADVTILAAKASGYVTAVEVENNQTVQAGQVIARIDDVDYRLAVRAAQDKLATQNASVERIARQIEAAEAQVRQAEPQIAAARAESVRAAADYDRQARLSQSDFASRARLEQAQADRDRAAANVLAAEAGFAAARANVDVLKAQKDEADRVAAEYRTAVARAERDLSFATIRAPVTGVLGNRAVEVGAYVQPGTRLAALIPFASVRVDANFKETQLARIHPGQKVEFEVDAYPDRQFEGRVESISPASGSQFSLLPPENATGNFTKIVQRVPVRIRVEQADDAVLRPGMSVVVHVDTRAPRTAQAAR
ncbi:HlyD family secretion protein [Enterovirga sp. CN4-39]|uniref:HlyD family secretion protein n=1 Tax=Enterovirga sp. CN4-39 TaxID=3400910 RepID=UPI003C114C3F